MDIDKILKNIEENAIEMVRFEQVDGNGIAISRNVPSRHFKKKAEGGIFFAFGIVIGPNYGYHIEKLRDYIDETIVPFKHYNGDALCFPDLDTFTIIPWVENTARILVEPTRNGEPEAACSRVVARRQLDKLKDLGYSLFTAHEMEFVMVHRDTREPITTDCKRCGVLRNFPDIKFAQQIMRELPKVGVDIECMEGEFGYGQCEFTYAPAFGIRAADNAYTFKLSVKEIARQHDYIASFMSIPYADERLQRANTSVVQVCHSLWDLEGKVPLTYDSNKANGLSQIAQHWIAGLLAHAPALTVLMCPTHNCFSIVANQKDAGIPHAANWGLDNRATLVRVKINGPKGSYLEHRLAGGPSDPYITLAATIAAGIDGIKRKLPLPEEAARSGITPGAAMLPTNMKDGLQAFLDDDIIKEAMGKEFVELFVTKKKIEMNIAEKVTAKGDTNWERDLYFEYL